MWRWDKIPTELESNLKQKKTRKERKEEKKMGELQTSSLHWVTKCWSKSVVFRRQADCSWMVNIRASVSRQFGSISSEPSELELLQCDLGRIDNKSIMVTSLAVVWEAGSSGTPGSHFRILFRSATIHPSVASVSWLQSKLLLIILIRIADSATRWLKEAQRRLPFKQWQPRIKI